MQATWSRIVLLLWLLGGAVAHAQPGDASAGKVPVARRLYDEGVEAAGKGRWSLAHDRFKASYELSPRVLTLFNLAGAQTQTQRFVEASESYRRFLRETSDGRYADLRSEATNALEELEKQIAQLTIDVTNLAASDTVTVDDAVFPHSALREPLPINPGERVITIRRGGTEVASKSVKLSPGEAESVKLSAPVVDLRVQPSDPGEPGVTGGSFSSERRNREEGRSVLRSPWVWTAAAVVLVGGAVGVYYYTRSDDDVLVVR